MICERAWMRVALLCVLLGSGCIASEEGLRVELEAMHHPGGVDPAQGEEGHSTRESRTLITDLGFEVRPVPLAELGKAEAGPTCLSLLVEDA